jgi:NTE family protein
MKELRMMALLRQVADPDTARRALGWNAHARIMTDTLADFGASSKMNAEWAFVSR